MLVCFVFQGPVTVDELLEMGRAKLMNHDLALEMSRLSETSETLATDKQVHTGIWFLGPCHTMSQGRESQFVPVFLATVGG